MVPGVVPAVVGRGVRGGGVLLVIRGGGVLLGVRGGGVLLGGGVARTGGVALVGLDSSVVLAASLRRGKLGSSSTDAKLMDGSSTI